MHGVTGTVTGAQAAASSHLEEVDTFSGVSFGHLGVESLHAIGLGDAEAAEKLVVFEYPHVVREEIAWREGE